MYSYEIIMPAYNAGEHIFDTLTRNARHADNLIVVDDCSKDSTYNEVQRFNKVYSKNVRVHRLTANGHKVGAIKKGVELAKEMGAEYIFLTDDDTTIVNSPDEIYAACKKLDEKNYAGASLVTKPRNPIKLVEKLQAMEYETLEYLKDFLSGSGTQRCINGAGGIFKIEPLREILQKHSNDHDGDDIEVTYALQKMGHHTGYIPEIIVETNVPDTLSKRIKQNERWERGSMKTMGRYKDHVVDNIKKLNRLSFVQGTEALGHFTLGVSRAALDTIVALYSGITEKDAKKLMLLPIYVPYTLGVNVVSRSLACRDIAEDVLEKSGTKLYGYEQEIWEALNEAIPISEIGKLAIQVASTQELDKYRAEGAVPWTCI